MKPASNPTDPNRLRNDFIILDDPLTDKVFDPAHRQKVIDWWKNERARKRGTAEAVPADGD